MKITKLIIVVHFLLLSCKYIPKEYTHPQVDHLPEIKYYSTIVDAEKVVDFHELSIGEFAFDVKEKIIYELKIFEEYQYLHTDNMALSPSGDIFVINKYEYSIDRISQDGTLIERIGRAGRGPGEFENIISFTLSQDFNALFVIDNTQIEIFEFNNETDEYKHTESLNNLFLEAYDICFLDGRLYLSGFDINREYFDELKGVRSISKRINGLKRVSSIGPILSVDLESRELEKDFGYEYKSFFGFGIYDAILSRVELSCNDKAQTVIAKMKYAPIVFGYSKEGDEKWSVQIKNVRDEESLEKINPVYGVSWAETSNENKFDRTMPFREIFNSEYVILQFEEKFLVRERNELSNPTQQRQFNFLTGILNTNTGEIDFLRQDGRYFLASADNRLLFSTYNDSLGQHDYYLGIYKK